TSMSTVFDKKVDISPPSVDYENIDELEEVFEELNVNEVFVRILFTLRVGELINSNIMQLMPLPFAKQLVEDLLVSTETAATTASVIETIEEEANRITGQLSVEREAYEDTASSTQTSKQQEEPQYLGQAIDSSATVQQASFSEFEPVEM